MKLPSRSCFFGKFFVRPRRKLLSPLAPLESPDTLSSTKVTERTTAGVVDYAQDRLARTNVVLCRVFVNTFTPLSRASDFQPDNFRLPSHSSSILHLPPDDNGKLNGLHSLFPCLPRFIVRVALLVSLSQHNVALKIYPKSR